MLSFLRPSKPTRVEDAVDENRLLLREFDALDAAHRDQAGDRLAVLWNCFVEEFRSPAEFHTRPRDAQDDYIAKFERVAARTQAARHSPNGHLHYSVALMLHFLLVARDGARQQSALDLSGRVALLINEARERQIAVRRSSIVDALSLSLLDPNRPEITEVVVESPEFHFTSEVLRPGRASASVQEEDGPHQQGAMASLDRAGESGSKRPRVPFLRQAG